jgi:hypothetical protein
MPVRNGGVSMAAFRLMLAGMLLVLAVYTGAVTYQYGPDFLPVFFRISPA